MPYERTVQLTGRTVAWHRKANLRALETQVVGQLARGQNLYGFVRRGVAQALEGIDPSPGLNYVEVKVGPCFFDFKKPPPKISLHWDNLPFRRAITELMKQAARSYLIGPGLADRPPMTVHLDNLDWREAAVRIMLDADVFVEPIWYRPISLRSYEYQTRDEFIAAVNRVIDSMKSPTPEAPLTIVPWEQWVLNNRAYQLRYEARLRSLPTTQQLGPPPGTAMLSTDLAIAKKQILYALPYQLRPSPAPSRTSKKQAQR